MVTDHLFPVNLCYRVFIYYINHQLRLLLNTHSIVIGVFPIPHCLLILHFMNTHTQIHNIKCLRCMTDCVCAGTFPMVSSGKEYNII